MKRLITGILAVILAVCVSAQAPQKMSYQAVVRNSAGELVKSQTIGMKVSILQGSETGAVIYNETLTPATNANGLVTTVLSINDIDWSSGPYFIKTETDPTGGTNYGIVGISPLLSVPYSLYSETSESALTADYNNLSNLPTLFDGQYNSLFGLPTLFDGKYTSLTELPTLFDGQYNSLSGLPTLFDSKFTSLTDKPTTLTGYGITDAMSTLHPANEITEINKQYWNIAHSWGDHSVAGYLKSTTIGINPNFFKMNLINTVNDGLFVYSTASGQWEVKPITDFASIFAPISHTHADATPSFSGFMSVADKLKLDNFNTVGQTAGDILMFNGIMWVVKSDAFSLPGHTHLDATSTVSGFMSGADKTKLNAVDGSETKINSSADITVKGKGTVAEPYVLNQTQHFVGESYGGGIVFYVYDNGQHGLIAATADATVNGNPNLSLLYNGPLRVAGAFGNGVGAGKANTSALVAMQASLTPGIPWNSVPNAAYACIYVTSMDANNVRNADWYLPSYYEMVLMSNSTAVIPGFSKSNPYWSSTEDASNINNAFMVINGTMNMQDKRNSFRARPIRSF